MVALGNATNDVLFYTSSLSDHMHVQDEKTAFQGLYMCSLNTGTGKCRFAELIVNRWNRGGERHRGLRLRNVALDDSKSMLYSLYFEGTRRGFEILRAPLIRPIELQSFFRTKGAYSNSDCGLECCAGAEHTYLNTKPRSYLIEGEEIFISWGGIYQDCGDEFQRKANFKWTIGVSKLEQRPDCILTGTQVDFATCTTPIALAYQGDEGEDDIFLGYSSFQSSLSPSGNRVFFLSVLRVNAENRESQPVNEIWAVPEGEVYAKNPNALQVIDRVPVHRSFMYHSVDNVGSIRMKLDNDGIATSLCTTAYDWGILCLAFSINRESKVEVSRRESFVTSDQIKEKCTLKASHVPLAGNVPPVASGLEIVWTENSRDPLPEMVFFGCLGEIPEHGNFVTAFRDGTLVQTVDGAFPGSILFGKSISDSAPTNGTSDGLIIEPAAGDAKVGQKGFTVLLFATFAAALITMSVRYVKIVSNRRREAIVFNRLLERRNELAFQESIHFDDQVGMTSTAAYTELTTIFH